MQKETSFLKKPNTSPLSYNDLLEKKTPDQRKKIADNQWRENKYPDADEDPNKDQSIHDLNQDEPIDGKRKKMDKTRMTRTKMKMSSKLLSFACNV